MVTFENVHTDYVNVINGRVYFTLGDIQIDVTDECGGTSYFCYEIRNSDVSRIVICGSVAPPAGSNLYLIPKENMLPPEYRSGGR